MKEKILEKFNEFKSLSINTMEEAEKVRVEYLGKKGIINEYTSMFSTLSNEEKKEIGIVVNDFRCEVNNRLDEVKRNLEAELINKRLENERIDISLPGTHVKIGTSNLIERVSLELESLLMSMGFDVVEGPEVEEDLYNFELLNLPKGHPARDAQDTFYIKDETILLRSQTSPVQIRTMLANKEKDPIRIIVPGKTYRRDDDDAIHSHQFTQMEGLLVDKEVSLGNLEATFDVLAKHLFGSSTTTRFRPSFYPFTEPSVEMDVSCFNCGGKGCGICKETGWITIGGAGVVHHQVLDNCGYDSKKYSGFAFGFGLERIAMLKYGIKDTRTFYTNDLRERKSFNRREA